MTGPPALGALSPRRLPLEPHSPASPWSPFPRGVRGGPVQDPVLTEPHAQDKPMSVVHFGRSTRHATSGRGISQLGLPNPLSKSTSSSPMAVGRVKPPQSGLWAALTPNTVELMSALRALSPTGGPVQDPVLT